MKIELTTEQIKVIADSLYYANCRLGQPKMASGKYGPEATQIMQILGQQKKEAEERKIVSVECCECPSDDCQGCGVYNFLSSLDPSTGDE